MSNKVVFGTLAVVSSVLALGSVLNVTVPSAQAFEVERTRGSNKASRIVRTEKVQAQEPTVKAESQKSEIKAEPQESEIKAEPQASSRRSTIFVRGNHGAQKLVTQEGVGGPTREYKGFPKLEQRGSHGAYHIVND